MTYFKDLDSLFLAIETDIHDALTNEVADHAIDKLKDSIRKNVYDKYTPQGKKPYKRLYDSPGGFLHDESFSVEKVDAETVRVRSIRSDGDRDVAQIVEQGYPYTWTKSKIYEQQPYPRPFHEPAKREMESTNSYVEVFKDAMVKKGYKFDK